MTTFITTPAGTRIYDQPVEWRIYSRPLKATRWVKARSEYQAREAFAREYGAEVTTITVETIA